MFQFLNGYKTYIIAFAWCLFGTVEYFWGKPQQIDIKTYGDIVAQAAAIAGLRSGLAVGIQKILAGLGISLPATASVEQVKDRAATNGILSGARRVLPALLVAMILAPALVLYGCGTTGGAGTGGGGTIGSYQLQVYNTGEDGWTLLEGVDLVAAGIPIPPQVCAPLKTVYTLYLGAENTVRDPRSNGSAQEQALAALEHAIPAAIAAAATLGLDLATFAKARHAAGLTADPTPAQWDTLNGNLKSGVAGLGC